MLFIELVHEGLDQGQNLAGREQQVAFQVTLLVDRVGPPLFKVNVFGIEGLAPSGVIVYVVLRRVSSDGGFLWVEAAVVWVQMRQSGVVVGVYVGQMHLSRTRLCQRDEK